MPSMNTKNMGLSPAAVDLGLTPMRSLENVEETEDEKKKRLMGSAGGVLGSPASMMLFGAGGTGV